MAHRAVAVGRLDVHLHRVIDPGDARDETVAGHYRARFENLAERHVAAWLDARAGVLQTHPDNVAALRRLRRSA